jgi:cytochrome P450
MCVRCSCCLLWCAFPQVGKYHIPARTNVSLMIASIHRNPGLWPDPDRFDPARFTNGVDQASRHPGAFLPFG